MTSGPFVPDVLYRSDTILVRSVAGADRSRWIITFDNHSIGQGFDRPGFGEDYLRGQGISAVHVLGCGNDWYQYPDTLIAAAAVRRALAGASRRLAYGSSMGGYAALRLADAVGADAVLALSPQYSNDPRVVPWELRWEQDAHRITWQPSLAGGLSCKATAIVYDPMEPDRRHAELIGNDVPIVALRAPHAGHPAGTFLVSAGLLGEMVHGALDGTLDASATMHRLRRCKHRSAIYLGNLALRQPQHRGRLAVDLARRAVDRSDNPLVLSTLASVLTAHRRHDEALPLHAEVAHRSGRVGHYLIAHAEALIRAGSAGLAVPIAYEVSMADPQVAHLQHWLAHVLESAGHHRAAIHAEWAALRLLPRSRLYRTSLVRRIWRGLGAAMGRRRSTPI